MVLWESIKSQLRTFFISSSTKTLPFGSTKSSLFILKGTANTLTSGNNLENKILLHFSSPKLPLILVNIITSLNLLLSIIFFILIKLEKYYN